MKHSVVLMVASLLSILFVTLHTADDIVRGMDDTFFIVIEARDPRFNLPNTKALLEKAGGKNIQELEA